MLTLRYPRLFAFALRLPTIPLPFRADASPLLKLIGKAPARREAREKIVRKERTNPTVGIYGTKITRRACKGAYIARRRELFRGQAT